MATSRPPPKPLDLDITVVSAKHLKNVNWRHGDLKPYVTFRVDPEIRSTKHDDSGSTRPVWNERFVVPLTTPLQDSILVLEVLHFGRLDSNQNLVGSLRLPLTDLIDSDDSARLGTYELRRPSGRPHGKIRIKLAVREKPLPPAPDYHITPQPSYYYSTAPPPPPSARDYSGYSPSPYTGSLPPPPQQPPLPSQLPKMAPPPPTNGYQFGAYSDPYPGYYSGYYSQPPPPPPRPFFDRQFTYGGPSAPVDYTPYDQKPKGGKMGLGTGLAVGAVAGTLGGLALDEGLKYEEDKIAERVENDLGVRDNFSDYRVDY
ncbi:actin cytoskeleton-regulatory complex protein pan-1-like [Cornus florida]|uniref:actin cytoskeleton-regulatory complex protein pan-1-like n=1 Tax=Cornus florida TaxID=4283 RepID=UPI00289AC004|nr:actin cytoskeleton-regulatory complex protein pan-1-like [Cornus florida]